MRAVALAMRFHLGLFWISVMQTAFLTSLDLLARNGGLQTLRKLRGVRADGAGATVGALIGITIHLSSLWAQAVYAYSNGLEIWRQDRFAGRQVHSILGQRTSLGRTPKGCLFKRCDWLQFCPNNAVL